MQLIAVVGLLGVAIAGGAVWLLVRDERATRRAHRARALRRLTEVSAAVTLVTAVFLRPWYWDLAIATVAVAATLAVHRTIAHLEDRPSPASGRAVVAAMATVVLGSALVTLAGTSAVLDGAALAGGRPIPQPHGDQVLTQAVLYQLFWGKTWEAPDAPPALAQAVSFQRSLDSSTWGGAVVDAGFGVRSLSSGGCWIDPDAVPAPTAASSTTSGPFPTELRRALTGQHRLVPCPGMPATAVPRTLPPDAVVALWLDPDVTYGLGGVSAHGSVPWPGRPHGLAAAGLTGGFASWGLPSCATDAACRGVPAGVTPAYALSHEVVEAVTNPYGQGWFADAPVQWAARYFLSHGPTSLLGSGAAVPGRGRRSVRAGAARRPSEPRVGAIGRPRFGPGRRSIVRGWAVGLDGYERAALARRRVRHGRTGIRRRRTGQPPSGALWSCPRWCCGAWRQWCRTRCCTPLTSASTRSYAHAALRAPLLHRFPLEYPAPALVVFLLPLLLGFSYPWAFALLVGGVLLALVLAFTSAGIAGWDERAVGRLIIYLALGEIMVVVGPLRPVRQRWPP